MGKGGGKGDAESGLTGVGNKVAGAAAQTPQESQQYSGSFDMGNLLKQMMMYQQGLGGAPQGYLDPTQQFLQQGGALGKTLYDQTLSEAQDPDKYYMSTLQPGLQQAQDFVNASSARRGLLQSGLNIEQMGRAGVDLAMQEAQGRMQERQNAMAQAAGLSEYMTGQSQNNMAGLANLYSQQQNAGLSSMGRQAQGAQAAGQYWAQPYQAKLGDYYGGKAAQRALPGQLIGAAGNIVGGMATGGTGFFA